MSKKQRLTPWFPIAVSPARDGVYQTLTARALGDSDWEPWHAVYRNGVWFASTSFGVDCALEYANDRKFERPEDEVRQWRGLAQEPK